MFKFIKYTKDEDVAIDVVTYLNANGAVVRTGRYNHSNRIVRVLKAITPEDIVNWFNYLAYGKENPAENEKPQFARANTLYSNKKKLSYYMINKTPHWSHAAQTGNPTKDKSVNDLLKKIKKNECRGTGKSSLSSQAFDRPEMVLITNGAQDLQDSFSFQHPALITLQNTMIGRNDDMNHIAANEIKVNMRPGFEESLTVQMHWSKNVVDENQVTPQIVLGSVNSDLCPLIRLSCYISTLPEDHYMNSATLFHMSNSISSKRLRKVIQMVLQNTTKRFATHSIRKHAASFCEQMGVPRETVNYRGRWRRIKAASNVYYSNDKPRKDCIAAIGTMGRLGACRYLLEVPAGLIQALIPASKYLENGVGQVLVKALVWACLNTPNLVPQPTLQRLETYRLQLGDTNLLAMREQVMMHPSLLQLIAVDGGASGDLNGVSINLIQAQLTSIQAQLTQMSSTYNRNLSTMTNAVRANTRKVNALVRNIDKVLYYRREDNFESGTPEASNNNDLMLRVPTIGMLWQEYQTGIGRNKPAKLFTAHDRGRKRWIYSKRKVFWSFMVKLIDEGNSYTSALTNIDVVYGYNGASVSKIIRRIRKDAKESYKLYYERYPLNR